MKVYQHNLLMCKLKVQEDPIWVSYQMQWNMIVLTILFLIWNQTDSIRFLSYFFPNDHIFLLFFVTERNSVWFQSRRKIVKTITSHPLLWNPNRFLGMQKWHFLPPRFKKPPKKIWSFFRCDRRNVKIFPNPAKLNFDSNYHFPTDLETAANGIPFSVPNSVGK